MTDEIQDKEKKIAFLEDILTFAKTNLKDLLANIGKESLINKNGTILFVSDHAPMEEGCHIYLKLDKNKTPYFHIKKTMHYKTEKVSAWDNKDCLTPEEALEYASRYLPHKYDVFTEQVKLEF